MEYQQGNSIYGLIGASAVVVVVALLATLDWGGLGSGTAKDLELSSGPAVSSAGVPEHSVSSNATQPSALTQPADTEPNVSSSKQGMPGKDGSTIDAPRKDGMTAGPSSTGSTQSQYDQNTPSHIVQDKTDGPVNVQPLSGEGKTPVSSGKGVNSGGAQPPPQPSPTPAIEAKQPQAPNQVVLPIFELVRIEPSGENVFTGRVVPGATVEMIRDGAVYARSIADTSGLFALVAPPLAAGPSHIYLKSIAPDGTHAVSRESLTVVIGTDKIRRPLVALTSPDKPTVILSNPDMPDAKKNDNGEAASNTAKPPSNRPEIKIETVEARDGGRLFVSGIAAPGASVKLYINGAMVAPGGADAEGKLFFTIPSGMVAGDYLVRLDDVDPVSNQIKSKVEVHVKIPEQVNVQTGPVLTENQPAIDGPKTDNSALNTAHLPQTIVVSRGDSLWRISERHYGSGYLFSEIYDTNLRKIKNPNTIFPGQVLILPSLSATPHQ